MRVLLMGLVVLLAGCAAREPEVRTVRVAVPVTFAVQDAGGGGAALGGL